MPRTRVTQIDDPRAVGERVAAMRRRRGLSLRALAFAGCSAPYISAIEKGRRVPSLQVMQELASRLGVSPEFLATGEATSLRTQVANAELAVRLGEHDEARTQLTGLAPRLRGELRARAHAALGVVAIREGDLPEAVRLLEAARDEDESCFLSLPVAVEELGRAYSTRGSYEQAIALFRAARDAAVTKGDRPRALKSAVLLANVYIDMRALGHSADMLADALQDAAELRDPMLRASVLWSQARLHTLEGRNDLAAELAERALATVRVNEDERTIALAHQTLAYIELERDNASLALRLLEDALPLVERAAQPLELAVYELERARALLRLDRTADARSILRRVAPRLRESTRVDGGRSLLALAELFEQLGETGDALTAYDLAIERLAQSRNPHLVQAYTRKSRLLESLGRTEEAFAALKGAVAADQHARPEPERTTR